MAHKTNSRILPFSCFVNYSGEPVHVLLFYFPLVFGAFFMLPSIASKNDLKLNHSDVIGVALSPLQGCD